MLIVIKRSYKENHTSGVMDIYRMSNKALDHRIQLFTLERPWKDNQRSISCIPEGVYTLTPDNTGRWKDTLEVMGVPNRSEIEFHVGNFVGNTEGCILVGAGHSPDRSTLYLSRKGMTKFRGAINGAASGYLVITS